MLGDLPEEEVLALVAKAKQGDAAGLVEAGEALVSDRAWKCRRNWPRCLEVEELLQIGYLALLQAAKTFRPGKGAKFVTHAYRRIDGALLTANKKESVEGNHRQLPDEGDFLDDDEVPPELVVYDQVAADPGPMLSTLTGMERRALELRHGEEMTFKEIAKELGVSVRTAKSHVADAARKLRDRFPRGLEVI
jgi:RNA polymerase sigma factor (sigma-70 family)